MSKKTIFSVLIGSVLFWSCEDQITVDLPSSEPVVVIDAWINNKPETQTIKVLKTIPYFNDTFLPGISNATVQVEDLTDGEVYEFEPGSEDGEYIWEPTVDHPLFGKIGNGYKLTVQMGNTVYIANSSMNRVPPIDSVTFRYEEENSFLPESYVAQFYATDIQGANDTYWIKAWKNGTLLSKPSEINISYDAGGSPGAIIDGITFITPIREAINPFDQDDDNNFLSPYSPGDSVYVEILSINNEAYTFLSEVKVQIDRPGGFAELFAQPLANVSTNMTIDQEMPNATPVIGFFNISAVSGLGKKLDPDNLPTKED